MRLVLADDVELIARSSKGEAVEPVDAEYDGEPMHIGLMSGHVAAALASVKGGAITMAFGAPEEPVSFVVDARPDRRGVVMPCHI